MRGLDLIMASSDCRFSSVVYSEPQPEGPIYSGYVPFHSAEFVATAFFVFRVDQGWVPYRHILRIQSRAKESCLTAIFEPQSLEARIYEEHVLPLS